MSKTAEGNTKYHVVRRVMRRAVEAGALCRAPGRVVWFLHGNCTDPHYMDLWSRNPLDRKPMGCEIYVRCRLCDRCRWARTMHWTQRAQNECAFASRTWFGTFTFRPNEHQMMLHQCRYTARERAVDFDTLSPKEQFRGRCTAASRYLTLYLKRLRKSSNTTFRYLLVAEPHKSMLPHYHMLLHEQHGSECVRHATMSGCWPHGFSSFKLADDDTSKYICKYLSKTASARVRASKSYGTPLGIVDESPT